MCFITIADSFRQLRTGIYYLQVKTVRGLSYFPIPYVFWTAMKQNTDPERILANDMAHLWEVLLPEQRSVVTRNFTLHSFKKNQLIYAGGETPESLLVLLEGKVKTFKSGVGDRVQIIRLYRPVQYFGYRAYFAGENYTSSAAAFEPSIVGCIPMKVVELLLRENNALARFFIHELSRNLGGSDDKIVTLTQKHIRGRLAEALLLLADNYGLEDDDATLRICMSREDLASLSNMTSSNATRTLGTFVEEKLILVDGRRIKIINPAQLKKISRYG